MTVVDEFDNRHQSPHSYSDGLPDAATMDLETHVLFKVREDPFASIWELKRDINRSGSLERATWTRVFGVLRRNGLLSRRARFTYARRYL